MADNPTPIEVQKHLAGLDYPASKDDIVTKAESEGGDEKVMSALRGLPEKEYDGPNAISKELAGQS